MVGSSAEGSFLFLFAGLCAVRSLSFIGPTYITGLRILLSILGYPAMLASSIFSLVALPLYAAAAVISRADNSTSTSSEKFVNAVFEEVSERPLPVSALRTNGDAEMSVANVGGVYICDGTDWTGKCGYAVQPLDTCIVLGSDWKKKIASFGPDQCTICHAYASNQCSFYQGWFWIFQYPGSATGGRNVPNNDWSNRIQSFKCWRSPDCY
ncbi:hypothetical protein C8Q76DRAFT_754412 [Earliella scabrosa]|nr:hypothetical protein C8Q76DRAFT_754412 [Earliella scabrosa]